MVEPPMTTETSAEPPEWLAPLREYPTFHEASEHALVVLAMNLSCWLMPGPSGYTLCVESEQSDAIRRELLDYDAEQRGRPPVREVPWTPSPALPSLLWVFAVTLVFLFQDRYPEINAWGANSSLAVFRDHEWWRPLSALFLHADFHHLAGNLLAGAIFFTLTSRTFGHLAGWTMVLASGIAGNLATAWLHFPEPFRAVGASTAVFGALGLLTAVGAVFAWRGHGHLRAVFAPLGGGLTLLGWLGMGGPNVDITGHLCGFAAGILLGSVAALRLRALQ